MKDLDFDELDRAVNTLMNDVPKSDLSSDDQIKTLSIDSTIPDDAAVPTVDATPASPASDSAPAATPVVSAPTPQQKSAVTPPAARRGGRFMDVVHHSSDMKKDQPATPATRPQPVSRQGVTIDPIKSTAPSMAASSSVAPAVQSEPVIAKKEETVSAPTDTASMSDWPDPLDMSTPKSTPASQPEPIVEQPDPMPLLEEGSETAVTTPASEDLQPLTSPFLSDAKVEKRPLGSGQPSLPTEEAPEPDHTPVVSNSDIDLTANNPADQLPATPEAKKDLPPELQGDLVAIESGSAADEAKPEESEKASKEEVKESKSEEREVKAEPTPHPTALLEANSEDDKPEFTGPTSIAQQYKEEPNTGDPKNGAIYDTDTYHKPLAHPAQKKSGWLWVIWIVLILLVGAGAGAALYFLRII